MTRVRLLTIAGLLAGGTLLPVAAAVAIFGCCHLPFHGLVHRVMPLCELATEALAHQHDEDRPAVPAPSRPDPKPSPVVAWRSPERLSIAPQLMATSTLAPAAPGQPIWRSLPAGAFRCDDDVGSRLASVDTLRI